MSPCARCATASRPKFEPLRTLRHGQPAQDQDGNGVWPVAANAAGRSLVGDRARCQGIKADHGAAFIEHDKGAAGAAELVGVSAALEPFVQTGLAALEGGQVVVGGEGLGGGQVRAHSALMTQGA